MLANRNVNNGVTPILSVIGGLPPGTPAAFEAAFGWGWLVELLEDYGFEAHLVHPLRCKAIASARLKNDQGRRRDLGAAAARRPAARGVDRAARRPAAAGAAAAPGAAGPAADAAAEPDPRRASRPRPRPARWVLERAGPGMARLAGAARRLGGGGLRRPGAHRRPGIGHRSARRRGPQPRQERPAGHDLDPAARRRPVHRAGPAGRDRRHHPVRLRAQAGVLGRAHPGRPRLGPHRPARAHPGQGSVWVRWILCEAAQKAKHSPQFAASYQSIARRRGTKIATTAIARKLLTRAYHLLTDAASGGAPS